MTYTHIDTHAHLNLDQFSEDRAEVIKESRERGVAVINVGTHKTTSELSMALAGENENMWSIVGLHPIEACGARLDPLRRECEFVDGSFDYGFYRSLTEHDRVVGIGECGFDYWHNPDSTYEQQREIFMAQIALANETGLPLMLHIRNSKDGKGRNAYDDALGMLKTEAKVPGNAHFYAGTWEQAKQFFDMGFTISFTGVITFAKEYEQIVKDAPLEMIHGETDCPYVAPSPYRGRRCEPWMVVEVYKKISDIRGKDEEGVRQQLLENAKKLYRL